MKIIPHLLATEKIFMGTSLRAVRDLFIIIISAVLLSLVLKLFIYQVFLVPSGSMSTTIIPGDRVIATQLINGDDIKRGDVVVFDDPGNWITGSEYVPPSSSVMKFLSYVGFAPSASDHYLVKRVIGVSGDHVVCCDAAGKIQVNGVSLDEEYLSTGMHPSGIPFDITVPQDSIWVMGDNRSNSADSRYHMSDTGGGSVSKTLIFGKVIFKILPLDEAGKIDDYRNVFANVPSSAK